jgi:hypothetical protein
MIQNTDPPRRHANPHCATVEKDTQIRERGGRTAGKKEKRKRKERKREMSVVAGEIPLFRPLLHIWLQVMVRRSSCSGVAHALCDVYVVLPGISREVC